MVVREIDTHAPEQAAGRVSSFTCKLCHGSRLESTYLLQRPVKNRTPYWTGTCADCGLFQDIYDWQEADRLQRDVRREFVDPVAAGGSGAPAWDSEEELAAAQAKARMFADQLAEMDLVRGKRILDVGCSRGFFLHECLRRGAAGVTGQEFFRAAPIEYATRELGVTDIRSVGFEDLSAWPDDEFDVVCSFDVIEHLHDLRSFFSDSIRLAKTGGFLFHATPGSDSLSNRLGRLGASRLGRIQRARTLATTLCNLQPVNNVRGGAHVSLLGRRPLEWLDRRLPLSVEAAYYASSYTHSNEHYASVISALRPLPRPIGSAVFGAVRAVIRNKLVFVAQVA